ncbi:NADH dehydrogenase subunit 5 [Alicyclobacillus sp.]|uniref:NADH dehydrogenase subunit 5 n=1 Tax=Alicyclobacillus sp. TaxID=61169 RepID=UPI0025BD813A|nr:NADH dehydrogenase subunit 5 [Alicyclobacillus sp.]MCL6517629.1 NADH dehydrogenase subunit 5 [Alicyclobacillus sp.]
MQHIGWAAGWLLAWLVVLLSGTAVSLRLTRARTAPGQGEAIRVDRECSPQERPRPDGQNRVTRWVRWHTGLLWIPVLMSLAGLVLAPSPLGFGPWRLDRLGWLMSLYIALLGLMIQTYSVRHLHGDKRYPQYFTGLTWVTFAATATWMSGQLALFACGWTAMGVFLTALIGLRPEWDAARTVAILSAKRFLLSAAAVGVAVVWLGLAAGSWEMPDALMRAADLSALTRVGISALLILAALIQAGNLPFHRWLMESAVTPTPVSAVMHAGLVNAGGLLLARMAPLFDLSGPVPHLVLLFFAWLSVAVGMGVMMVHVDYKRQLVASTMAQMGLMLAQCALGAYDAAIVHLMLHGLFKATLFLRSGSVVPRPERLLAQTPGTAHRRAWARAGTVAVAILLGLAYWRLAPAEPARALSGLFLAAGAVLAWRQAAPVRPGRWLGLGAVALAILIAEASRVHLDEFVRSILGAPVVSWPAVAVAAFVLFAGGALAVAWLAGHPSSRPAARLYLWLLWLGEPRPQAMEPHPRYLARYVKEATLQ